jgi:hypothetical protein
MERRTASHTEEEEMNQRRRLLNLARKGDRKAIDRLLELYQVRVYPVGSLNKTPGRAPIWPRVHQTVKKDEKPRHAARRRGSMRKPSLRARRRLGRKLTHR